MADHETLADRKLDPERVREAVWRLESLPALSPAVQKALTISGDPLCSHRDLERVLSVDQAVVTQLLRIANSVYYNLEGRVTTVSRAVTIIGHARLQSLLLQILLGGVLRRLAGGRQEANRILKYSVAAAASCRAVAECSREIEPEASLIAGLVHNIGDLVLLSEFPDQYGTVMRLSNIVSMEQAQTSVLGVTSNIVGRWLMECWGLPAIFAESTEHWKNPLQPSFDPDTSRFLQQVHVGIHLGNAWCEERGAETAESQILPEAFQQSSLTSDLAAELYDRLAEEVGKVYLLID